MNYLLGILFIIILFWIIKRIQKRKKFRAKLTKNWGKEKKKSYYNFFVIGKYFNNNSHKENAYHILSDKCKDDLDFDDVFKFIDRTSSKIGEQYLYYKLRTIGKIEKLLEFDSLVNFFKENKELAIFLSNGIVEIKL